MIENGMVASIKIEQFGRKKKTHRKWKLSNAGDSSVLIFPGNSEVVSF